jgi:hypothetical protein
VRVLAIVPASVILAVILSFPVQANTSSCSSVTPTSTSCQQIDSAFYNSSLGAYVDTYSGTFTADNNIQVFEIDATGNNVNLTIQSFGYGGGTDFAGNTISIPPDSTFGPLGGFASVFSLYDVNGNLLANSTFSGCGYGQINPSTLGCLDASLTATVAAGTYYLALTENDNSPSGGNLFSGGVNVDPTAFSEGSNPDPNFTGPLYGDGYYCPTTGPFCAPGPFQMDGNYDVDIALQTVVPEPGSFALVSVAWALGLGVLRRRRS